jgi:hypothetical protein
MLGCYSTVGGARCWLQIPLIAPPSRGGHVSALQTTQTTKRSPTWNAASSNEQTHTHTTCDTARSLVV